MVSADSQSTFFSKIRAGLQSMVLATMGQDNERTVILLGAEWPLVCDLPLGE